MAAIGVLIGAVETSEKTFQDRTGVHLCQVTCGPPGMATTARGTTCVRLGQKGRSAAGCFLRESA